MVLLHSECIHFVVARQLICPQKSSEPALDRLVCPLQKSRGPAAGDNIRNSELVPVKYSVDGSKEF